MNFAKILVRVIFKHDDKSYIIHPAERYMKHIQRTDKTMNSLYLHKGGEITGMVIGGSNLHPLRKQTIVFNH